MAKRWCTHTRSLPTVRSSTHRGRNPDECRLHAPEDYELTRDADNHTYTSPDDKVVVENGERFTATYKGATSAS